jgi:ATP-dependent DNA helicase DinG
VNHALFFTDLMVKEMTGGFASLIGPYDIFIADESHALEQWATSALGSTFREVGLRVLLSEIRNFSHRALPEREDEVGELCTHASAAIEVLWAALPEDKGSVRIHESFLVEHGDDFVGVTNALFDIAQVFITPGSSIPADLQKQHERIKRRLASVQKRFSEVVTAGFSDAVRWVETETTRKGDKRKVIRFCPIFVAPYLRESLFTQTTAILVSATIAVGEKFDYIADRLGIDEYDSLIVDSPFDFQDQASLYVPTHLPEPSYRNRDVWIKVAIDEIETLITASRGRALVLFTSVRDMKDAFFALRSKIVYPVKMQGDAPNKELQVWFRDNVESVLFATKSFWTGVDFSGETLSCLIIAKLPFAVPNEPLQEARCEAIERDGGSAFKDFVIPETTILLKQGFGRAIRRVDDRAQIAILDSRLMLKSYGKTILRSLPDAKRVTNLDEAVIFFEDFPRGKDN